MVRSSAWRSLETRAYKPIRRLFVVFMHPSLLENKKLRAIRQPVPASLYGAPLRRLLPRVGIAARAGHKPPTTTAAARDWVQTAVGTPAADPMTTNPWASPAPPCCEPRTGQRKGADPSLSEGWPLF